MGATGLLHVCLARKPTHVLYILWTYFARVKSYLHACVFMHINCRVKKVAAASNKAQKRQTVSLSIQPALHLNKRCQLKDCH